MVASKTIGPRTKGHLSCDPLNEVEALVDNDGVMGRNNFAMSFRVAAGLSS
jgi:hypothetical protein